MIDEAIERVVVGFFMFGLSALFGYGTYMLFTVDVSGGVILFLLFRVYLPAFVSIPSTIVFAWIGHMMFTK